MKRLDWIIEGGRVYDGTGAPARDADIGLEGGRIVAVGRLEGREAAARFPLRGKAVCPGFVDAHSHSDTFLLLEPGAPSKVSQGITAEVIGQCGASAAPLASKECLASDWRERTYPCAWRTMAEYLECLAACGVRPHIVPFVGHNTLRRGVIGFDSRPAQPGELEAMEKQLDRAFEEGARGFSSGLIYQPGRDAPPEELFRLAAVAARHDGLYSSHMRSEGAGLLEAIDETIEVARRTGVRVQISHLKASGRTNWGLMEDALERIERARAEGLDVAADAYPYTASCTDLDIVLPAWAARGGPAAILERLAEAATRDRIRGELKELLAGGERGKILLGTTSHPLAIAWRGHPLETVAGALNLPPEETVLRLIEHDRLTTGAVFRNQDETVLRRVLERPWVMLGTDASLRAPSGPLGNSHPHPRAYGAFPRFLRAAFDGSTVPPEEAIRKMTSLPAGRFGLEDRGRIAPGCAADLVLFDPPRVRDRATYTDPHRFAEGIEAVFIGGRIAWSEPDAPDPSGTPRPT